MKRNSLTCFSLLALLAAPACTDEPAQQEANFNESDEKLAQIALRALGADIDGAAERRCQSCHSVSRAKVTEWLELTTEAHESGCVPTSSRRFLYQPRTTGVDFETVAHSAVVDAAIPQDDAAGVDSKITVTERGFIRTVKVSVDIEHDYRGDLQVFLTKDGGEQIMLHDRTGGSEDNLVVTYDRTDELAGQLALGTYRLTAIDGDGHFWAADVGTLNGWGLEITTVADPAEVMLAEPNPGYIDPGDMAQGDALAMVDCLRLDSENPRSPFEASKMGIETIRAHQRNSHFRRLFQRAYDDPGERKRQFAQFVRYMKMPRGALFDNELVGELDPDYTVAIRKEDYWAIREWFDRGMADRARWKQTLEQVLPEDPAPDDCEARITPSLRNHVIANARRGWTEEHLVRRGIEMYGCTPPAPGQPVGWPESALACFPENLGFTDETDWETTYSGPAADARVVSLGKLDYRTSFWTRSSADGRFVANGRSDGPGSMISDLKRKIDIPVSASYDPGFGADNAYFMFQGTPVGAGFCNQELLLAPSIDAAGNIATITFREPGCSGSSGIRLYQHLGTAPSGVSFAANGDYTSDNGGHTTRTRSNPSATAGPRADVTITPIVPRDDGSGFDFLDPQRHTTPFEGDTAISPSSRVISARWAGGGGKQLGFTVRPIKLDEAGDNYAVSLGEPSTVCLEGGKTAHSYDDRFMTIHSYSDQGGIGKADVYVVDLYDGETFRVTDMPAGTYALFPHFRADGWLYFLIRDANPTPNKEYVAASDIALHIESNKPINDVSW